MSSAISVRLDPEALQALAQLEATGLSRSEAIRRAILDSAGRLRKPSELAAEVAVLEADDEDRREMLEVAAFMENVRAPGVTFTSSAPHAKLAMSSRRAGTASSCRRTSSSRARRPSGRRCAMASLA